MITKEEHGLLRKGKVTASVAHIVETGSAKAWGTLAKNLWADDGVGFAQATTGARAYGHEHEAEGAAKFWEHHPEFEIEVQPWFDYTGKILEFRGTVGASPDRIIMLNAKPASGLEIKSPTKEENMAFHTERDHYAQCGHGMLVTNLPCWYLVAHHGDKYVETKIVRNQLWEKNYIIRLKRFLLFLNEGKGKTKRLSVSDL